MKMVLGENVPLIGGLLKQTVKLPVIGTISVLTLVLILYVLWKYLGFKQLDMIFVPAQSIPLVGRFI